MSSRSESISEIRRELQGSTAADVCNREAGSFSRLWGRDCWVADTVLKLIQCSIDEEMNRHDPSDQLWKVWQYCEKLREQNRIGQFDDAIDA